MFTEKKSMDGNKDHSQNIINIYIFKMHYKQDSNQTGVIIIKNYI